MAENEQLSSPHLTPPFPLITTSPPPRLVARTRLSTLGRFSRLGDRRGRAPTEERACVAPRGGHGACVHARTHVRMYARMARHATKREIILRAACGPFVVRPYRRGGTDTTGRTTPERGVRERALARHASKTAARGLSPAYLPMYIVEAIPFEYRIAALWASYRRYRHP